MTDWKGAPRDRSTRGGPGLVRRMLTVIGVFLACYSLLGALPANAFFSLAGTTGTSGGSSTQPTGLETAATALIKPAPAGFRQQLTSDINQLLQADRQYPLLGQTADLQKAEVTAQRLVAAANDKDLAALNYLFAQAPSMSTVTKNLRLAGRMYTQATQWQSRRGLHTLNYDDTCPAPQATVPLITSLDAVYKFFSTLYEIFPASFTIEVFGSALTIPISPIRDVYYWIAVVATWAADFGATSAYKIRVDCTSNKHQSQHDSLTTYVQDHVANVQLNLAVTPIDVNHYIIAVHENGQPINVVTGTGVSAGGVQLTTLLGPASANGQTAKVLIDHGTPLLANGSNASSQCVVPATTSTTSISQVSFCPIGSTDAGLYELFLPTTLAGTSYRLVVDDGAQCPNDPAPAWPTISNCDHFGTAVFTKATNS